MAEHLVDSTAASMRLLGADDPAPASAHNLGGASPWLILGDHAGRHIPRRLKGLGLTPAALEKHIAWDIGVAALGARLSDALDAEFIAQRYSRLVIDCNRDPAGGEAPLAMSDGVEVPANQALSAEDLARRRAEIFDPYHGLIAARLQQRRQAARASVVLALHSFTPRLGTPNPLGGRARPWRFGVLHHGDSRISHAVLARLRAAIDADAVGDNEPYRMDVSDYTIARHAIAGGLDYLELEVRQDLIADAEGQREVAELLVPVLLGAVRD